MPGLSQCQKEMEEYYKDAKSVLAMNCQNDGDYHVCFGVVEYDATTCPPSKIKLWEQDILDQLVGIKLRI